MMMILIDWRSTFALVVSPSSLYQHGRDESEDENASNGA